MNAATTTIETLDSTLDFIVAEQPRYRFILDADLVHVGGGSAVVEY